MLGGLASHVPVLTLTENRRQREPWERAALNQMRNGSVKQALKAFDNHGRIERVETLNDVRARIVDAWADASRAGENSIMLAARRDDVHALNQLARTAVEHRLSGPGMLIDGATFQAGDLVMTLRNNARLDARNGERGTLLSIDKRARSMTIQMDDRSVMLPSTYLDAGHLAHGYAITVHKAQGLTVDRACVLGTDDLYREIGYVAMSRGRLGNHLYVVAEPTLEIEPLHGPSVERANEENLVAALEQARPGQWRVHLPTRSMQSTIVRSLRSGEKHARSWSRSRSTNAAQSEASRPTSSAWNVNSAQPSRGSQWDSTRVVRCVTHSPDATTAATKPRGKSIGSPTS